MKITAPSPLRKIFIGWDSREPVTFAVAAHSILSRASVPIAIAPLTRRSVADVYTRPRGNTEATEFSLTRFLVPYLSDYTGMSIFMDSDMLVRADILELSLYLLADPGKAVYCCQHDYIPKQLTKMDGREQTTYPRKNWSSFMVFDNAQCRMLTPHVVNEAPGKYLHRLEWLAGDYCIGKLPLAWNHLVGEYDPNPHAKVLHFTNGAPCFADYAACDQADLWWEEYREMLKPAERLGLVRPRVVA